jgi:hypothetical protein
MLESISYKPYSRNINSTQPLRNICFRGQEDVDHLLEALETKQEEKAAKANKPKDRDFNFDKALSNFGKGFISPITTMFSSATNFVVGAGTIGICAALMNATKGKIGKVLVASGILYGSLQTALGIKKLAKANNNDEREKAFYDIGAGTGIVAASAVTAKPALEAAGMPAAEAEALTITQSVTKCFKGTPKAVGESVNVINNPAAMTELVTNSVNKTPEVVNAGEISGLGKILKPSSTGNRTGAGVVASAELNTDQN